MHWSRPQKLVRPPSNSERPSVSKSSKITSPLSERGIGTEDFAAAVSQSVSSLSPSRVERWLFVAAHPLQNVGIRKEETFRLLSSGFDPISPGRQEI
jgi:hypothetical protein